MLKCAKYVIHKFLCNSKNTVEKSSNMFFRPIKFLAGILCAIVLSQFPEFSQQYQQRLGGKLDELGKVVDNFTEDANLSGQTVQDALSRMKESGDELIATRGERIGEYFDDFSNLLEQSEILATGGMFQKIYVIVLSLDTDLVIATYQEFSPAIPVSLDGFLLAGVGFVLGYFSLGLLLFVLKLGFRLIFRRRRLT